LPFGLGRPQFPAGPFCGVPTFPLPNAGRPQEAVGPNPLDLSELWHPHDGCGTLSPSSCRTAVASAGGFDTGREDCRNRRWIWEGCRAWPNLCAQKAHRDGLDVSCMRLDSTTHELADIHYL
jgi:hypothetical protein